LRKISSVDTLSFRSAIQVEKRRKHLGFFIGGGGGAVGDWMESKNLPGIA
jgi:hypothetical protein